MSRHPDWVTVAAAVEVVTGLVLIVRPSLFGRLLFGAEFSGPGPPLGRLAGFALLALAFACWPRLRADRKSAIRALVVFSLLSAIYLIYLGIGHRGLAGPLLWPAAAIHAALVMILIRESFKISRANALPIK